MKEFWKEVRAGLVSALVLGVLVSGIYPLAVWGVAQGLFHDKADGSMIVHGGAVAGSRIIGQAFTGQGYFHPRPSAAGSGYDAARSGGSNLGPLSKKLIDEAGKRAADYRRENGLPDGALVPADAVTASASGLDPHISPENALLQAPRVARERGLSEGSVRRMVIEHTDGRDFGFLGEPRVNVLMLNLYLDKAGEGHG